MMLGDQHHAGDGADAKTSRYSTAHFGSRIALKSSSATAANPRAMHDADKREGAGLGTGRGPRTIAPAIAAAQGFRMMLARGSMRMPVEVQPRVVLVKMGVLPGDWGCTGENFSLIHFIARLDSVRPAD